MPKPLSPFDLKALDFDGKLALNYKITEIDEPIDADEYSAYAEFVVATRLFGIRDEFVFKVLSRYSAAELNRTNSDAFNSYVVGILKQLIHKDVPSEDLIQTGRIRDGWCPIGREVKDI